MTTHDLTHEVQEMLLQKTSDLEYFTQIGEAIGDHASRLTALSPWCGQLGRTLKSDAASADDKVAQNAALANDNDSRLKQGLSLLEKKCWRMEPPRRSFELTSKPPQRSFKPSSAA